MYDNTEVKQQLHNNWLSSSNYALNRIYICLLGVGLSDKMRLLLNAALLGSSYIGC